MQLRRLALGALLALALALLAYLALHRGGLGKPAPAPPATEAQSQSGAKAATLEARGAQDSRTVGERSESAESTGSTPAPIEKQISPFANLRARFVDVRQRPVAGVELWDWRRSSQPIGTSGEDGKLEGRVRLMIVEGERMPLSTRHAEFVKQSFERVLHGGETLDLGEIRLERGGSVTGRVINEAGRPRPAINVHVAPAQDWFGEASISDGPSSRSSSGTTDEHGLFRLLGVPPGETRAWAIADAPPWAASEPFTVRASEETRDVEIRLPEHVDQPKALRFLVRTPDGAPAGGVELAYRARKSDSSAIGGMRSDADGVVTLGPQETLAMLGGLIDVHASDPDARWGGVAMLDIPIEPGDRELRLVEGRRHSLTVLDPDGKRVTEFRWRMLESTCFARPSWTSARLEPVRGLRSLDYFTGTVLVGTGEDLPGTPSPSHGGECSFASGSIPFVVQIDAPGFERTEVGPLRPADAPKNFVISLARLPGLAGVVVNGGRPVSGAEVRLMRAKPSLVNGFASRVEPSPTATTKSDSNGCFRLTYREPGPWFVQAHAIDLGNAECGPLTLAPSESNPDVVLEIVAPGRIEGQLLLQPDTHGEDWIVGASSGDGRAYSCRAARDGRFQLDLLMPGQWALHALEREIAPGEFRYGALEVGTPFREVDFPYLVRSGQTTRVTIDLREEAELAGTANIAGWDQAYWTAWLTAEGAQFGLTARATGPSEENRFTLRVRPPGEYTLGLFMQGPDAVRSETFRLNLHAGRQGWSYPGALGMVEIVNGGAEYALIEIRSSSRAELSSVLRVSVAPHATTTIPSVIPARYRVLLGTGERATELGVLDVQAGATARFERH